jgi:3-methyl-2-oxobutanoate hydroxymethyltransferase
MSDSKMTATDLKNKKGHAIAALTAYDYSTARLVDETGIDVILVGDSLGMVMLGYPDTTHVTLEDIIHHTKAVARGVKRAFLAADLPIHTYDTPEAALRNAKRLIEAGADGVKLEGGQAVAPQIRAITEAGIPFIGHLGMLPQHILEEGKYRIKGKTDAEKEFLSAEVMAVETAGATAVVFELIKPDVATELTHSTSIPTIGIGSGPGCDGQIQVFHDLVGAYPWFHPKHSDPTGDVATVVTQAVKTYIDRVGA